MPFALGDQAINKNLHPPLQRAAMVVIARGDDDGKVRSFGTHGD
jgi:hypothetical protein